MWAHNGRELFYRDANKNMVSVAVQTTPTFSAGATTVLFSDRDYNSNPNRRQYDVSPDDKRFIFVKPLGGAVTNSVIFVENWLEGLKRK